MWTITCEVRQPLEVVGVTQPPLWASPRASVRRPKKGDDKRAWCNHCYSSQKLFYYLSHAFLCVFRQLLPPFNKAIHYNNRDSLVGAREIWQHISIFMHEFSLLDDGWHGVNSMNRVFLKSQNPAAAVSWPIKKVWACAAAAAAKEITGCFF